VVGFDYPTPTPRKERLSSLPVNGDGYLGDFRYEQRQERSAEAQPLPAFGVSLTSPHPSGAALATFIPKNRENVNKHSVKKL